MRHRGFWSFLMQASGSDGHLSIGTLNVMLYACFNINVVSLTANYTVSFLILCFGVLDQPSNPRADRCLLCNSERLPVCSLACLSVS